ncbi:MAG: hypothetical protein VW985_00275, partial [Gammaproteobacteria bacterium]
MNSPGSIISLSSAHAEEEDTPDANRRGMALRTRLKLLGYLVTLGCSTLLGMTLFALSVGALLQNSLDDAQGALELIARGNASLVSKGDIRSLEQRFDHFGQIPGIQAVQLVDNDQQPIVTFSVDGEERPVAKLAAEAQQQQAGNLFSRLLGR